MKGIWNKSKEFQTFLRSLGYQNEPIFIIAPVNAGLASFFAEACIRISQPWIFIFPNREKAKEWAVNMNYFLAAPGEGLLVDSADSNKPSVRSMISGHAILFPDWNVENPDFCPNRFFSEFSTCLHALARQKHAIASVPVNTLTVPCILPDEFEKQKQNIVCGGELALSSFTAKLMQFGYEKTVRVENIGEFSYRGGILDVFIPAFSLPVRIELFGNEIVSIREFDPLTQRSISRVKSVDVIPVQHTIFKSNRTFGEQLKQWFSPSVIITWCESHQCWNKLKKISSSNKKISPMNIFSANPSVKVDIIDHISTEHQNKLYLDIKNCRNFNGNLPAFVSTLKEWKLRGKTVQIVYHRESVRNMLVKRIAEIQLDLNINGYFKNEKEIIEPVIFSQGIISSGFISDQLDRVLLSENDIIGKKKIQRWHKRKYQSEGLSFRELKPGDYVVHIDHGIGRYEGLFKLRINGRERDFLLLIYADNQKLYLPVQRMDLIQKYIGIRGIKPVIDKIGGNTFIKKKKKVKEAALKYATELIQLFTARKSIKGFAFPNDSTWQQEFEIGFEYEETPDQLKAIHDVKHDMEMPEPMDRLVCGDVGYGKTEVAMRAAFKAVDAGKQVCVLVPTTILAQQHFRTFLKRFDRFPINIAMLSRFLRRTDAKKVKEGLADGLIDIVIGTHALLSPDISFKNLGLVIIDEEQRFGVRHKEQLKKFRTKVDVLTLTATPIPRTLNMAMLGLKDISLINTPPEARRPIITKIIRFDLQTIKYAIMSELERNGQVYFVHNRIQSIKSMTDILKKHIPDAKFKIAHGQMPESKLEKIMLEFLEKKFDVLVSTTIIESGLDIPSVNTIIINRADKMGLSQLYQLRGRVGRDKIQAFAYCLIPASKLVSSNVASRLQALKEATESGSGFRLSMSDLEIRGAGDILGPNQHGHISAVGFELYCRLVKDAINKMKGKKTGEIRFCDVSLPVNDIIPDYYIRDTATRLDVYNRFANCTSIREVAETLDDVRDWFGPVPKELLMLSELSKVRIKASRLHVKKIEWKKNKALLIFESSTPVKPENIMSLLIRNAQKITFEQPNKLFVRLNDADPQVMINEIDAVLEKISKI